MLTLTLSSPQLISTTLKVLRAGGLVIFPTETVYGALVDPTNPQAVTKLLTYKRRPTGKAISIACANKAMAEQYVTLNPQAQKIYSSLLPGPVTVISQSKNLTSPALSSEKNTLGVRLPDYPPLIKLITHFQKPVTATSANASGKKTPYCIQDILTHLSAKRRSLIDLIIDAGTLPKNPPSLVIDTTTTTPTIIRPHIKITPPSLTQTFTTLTPLATRTLAQKIITQFFPTLKKSGLIIALDGPLGAGKTTFTQGLAQALSITDPITSPTYAYLKQYPFTHQNFSGTLYHFDAWTITDSHPLTLIDLPSLQKPPHLLVIEWYDHLASFFSPQIPLLKISLLPQKNPTTRQIIIQERLF